MKIKQTAGHDVLGEFAPQFAELNDEVLFGEVWSQTGVLPLKVRSMLTIASLVSKGITDSSLISHLEMGRKNGITKDEMAALLTHVAFYAGWPNAWASFRLAKEVYKDAKDEEGHGGFFGLGGENTAYAQYFIGKSYLKPLFKAGDIAAANVTFEPGCRNNWHIHHAESGGGQVLIVVEGEGYYQEEGKEVQLLKAGDIVVIPANVKHWHGARPHSWFSHIAFDVPGLKTSNEWLEPLDEESYRKLPE